MEGLGRILIITGIVIIAVGIAILIFPKIPFPGRLPGDFSFRWGNVSFHFPLATSIIISIVLTIVLNVLLRIFRD